jgi:hypothetical protein
MSELVTKPIAAELVGFAKSSTHPTTSTFYDSHQRNARLAPDLSRRLSSTPDIARPTKTRLLVGFLRPICIPLAYCANHDSASDLAAIADTSALLESPLRILA